MRRNKLRQRKTIRKPSASAKDKKRIAKMREELRGLLEILRTPGLPAMIARSALFLWVTLHNWLSTHFPDVSAAIFDAHMIEHTRQSLLYALASLER